MTGVTLNNLNPNPSLQPTDLIPDLPAGALEMQSITVAQLTAAAVAAEAPVIASLSTGVASLSTSTSTSEAGLSTGVASLSTGLISLSTSASTSEAGLSAGLSTVEGEISSLSTGAASLSTGLSASNALITSLSTAAGGTSVHFYSVDDTTATDGNYNNTGATGAGALAAGVGAVASHTHDTAVGYGAVASGGSSLALGEGASASGPQTTAVGYHAQAGYYSTALGVSASAGGFASAAVGPANANGSQTVAIGQDATANPTFSTALGAIAKALANEGDVALGWDAATATVVATGSAVIGSVTYSGFAGAGPTCTVSIGNGGGGAGGARTLTNLAAGQITAASTDAVNGSQLYAVAAAQAGPLTLTNTSNTADPPLAVNNSSTATDLVIRHTGGGGAASFNRVDTLPSTPPAQYIYQLDFAGRNNAGVIKDFAAIVIEAPSTISGSEAGQMQLCVYTPGQTLQSGSGVISGGSGFAVGDTIMLTGAGGVMSPYSNPMSVVITAETGGVPTAYQTSSDGLYTTLPSGFTQVSTSGTGTGFALTSPAWNGAGLAYRAVTLAPGAFTLSPGFAFYMGDGGTPVIDANGDLITQGYTVATLPAGVLGMRAHVTDAASPAFLSALTGGGSTRCPAFYNGTAWVAG